MKFFAGVAGLLLWISLPWEFAFALDQPSFECASAARTIERAICGDQTLIDLDGRMGQLYRQALKLATNRQQVIDGQRLWVTQRNTNCEKVAAGQFYECIVRYENERIQALSATIATMNKNAAAARSNPTVPSPAPTSNPPSVVTEKVAGPPPVPPVERSPPVEAQRTDYEGRMVGNWMTSAKEDRFGDGGTFTAITGDGSLALAVRCLQKNLSIGIGEIGLDPKPIQKGDFFAFKFRVDTQAVVEAVGIAISDRLIQVVTEKTLVKSIRDGKETAVRVESTGGITSTHIFNTSGSKRAFADLSRECPID